LGCVIRFFVGSINNDQNESNLALKDIPTEWDSLNRNKQQGPVLRSSYLLARAGYGSGPSLAAYR
jgi:hypothetical protein